MRITVRLESYGGFYFRSDNAIQPVEPGLVVVDAFGDTIYVAPMVDYAAIHDQLDLITKQRNLSHMNGGAEMSKGQQRSFIEVTFTLADKYLLVPLPNEEALVEWLAMCADSLYEPGMLQATIVRDGHKERAHFYTYDDAFERIRTGEVWHAADPDAMFAQMGVDSAEWTLATADGVKRGDYVNVKRLEGVEYANV